MRIPPLIKCFYKLKYLITRTIKGIIGLRFCFIGQSLPSWVASILKDKAKPWAVDKIRKINNTVNISFVELYPPIWNNVAINIKTKPIIKKPRGLPI